MTIDRIWDEVLTAALLGTDRREPPELPVGLLADTVADAARPDPATRMLDTVATLAAARRAAFEALPPAPPLQPPEHDDRPVVPAHAVEVWRRATADWPLLDEEWLVEIIGRGWRLPPDALVTLLSRTRRHPVPRARVLLAAGPLGLWLVDQVPDLAVRGKLPADLDPDALAQLSELPISPDLQSMLTLDGPDLADAIAGWFGVNRVTAAQRPMLTNLFARCRPGSLVDAADMLWRISNGVAQAMADLCRARFAMLSSLEDR